MQGLETVQFLAGCGKRIQPNPSPHKPDTRAGGTRWHNGNSAKAFFWKMIILEQEWKGEKNLHSMLETAGELLDMTFYYIVAMLILLLLNALLFLSLTRCRVIEVPYNEFLSMFRFLISGSEFVEMFVGIGAAKARDLFKQANEKAPCIV